MKIISAQNIKRTFVTGTIRTEVLRGIDFYADEGEYVAIMGKSGAGKSTLLYQLSVLDDPTEGSVTIKGVDVLKLNEREKTSFRLHTLGFIFQDYALVPDLSAEENTMIPLLMRGQSWLEAQTNARKALDEVELGHRYRNLPSQLSGGEQQRAAVARAIAGKPAILFADEPTANLDSISGGQIIDLLGNLHKEGQTIIMVTHEYEYTKNCNRIVQMEDGKITSEERK